MQFKEWLSLRESLALKGSYKGGIYQRLVAAKYMMAPTYDPAAEEAYVDLARKISKQDKFLRSKYEMDPTFDDPYRSMRHMTRDINRQKEIGLKPKVKVFAEPPQMLGNKNAGHPFFSDEENVSQRWVHDIIAHYFGQHPFSARGEYGAYNRHLKTLCNINQLRANSCPAAKAIFAEVVAQTSCYYVYGDYVDQKVVLLDDFDYSKVGRLNPMSSLNEYFFIEGKEMFFRDGSWDSFVSSHHDLAMELLKQNNYPSKEKLEPIAPQEKRMSNNI